MDATARSQGFTLTGKPPRLRLLLHNLWSSRDLIQTLARKDFYVRYRRASIGLLWAIGLPILQALVFVVIFTKITKFHLAFSYPVFVIVAMIVWTFFSNAIAAATTSIVDGSSLASKVYFPRSALPIISIWSNFHGYVPSVLVLIGVAAIFKAPLGFHLLLLIPATMLMLSLAVSFGLVFSALHVYFRDMRYIIQAAILPWFWATGVVFPLRRLGPHFTWLRFNPAVGMIELYRAAFGVSTSSWGTLALITLAWIAGLVCIALPLHRRYDRVFVDLL